MKKLLVIDNYDSFTYNLVHYIREHGEYEVSVLRNDQLKLEDAVDYDRIVFSPGPGIPDEAGMMKQLIKRYASEKKMLGVCLGMQAMGEVFGGTLVNLDKVYHGVAHTLFREPTEDVVLGNTSQEFIAGRYHSWVVSEQGFPKELLITSRDAQGQIMSLRHKEYPVFGLQFHPESILTPQGKQMIFNFLNL
ncbi:MAG: aminodeoxychorismate/anthranilate synthase component II [Bacteroidales bacterium]|nr:aminodeoxychorismate/anthranilate synthase component II [Bacteroidales bacterium]